MRRESRREVEYYNDTFAAVAAEMSDHVGRRLKSWFVYAVTFLTWLLIIRLRCFLSNVALKRSTVRFKNKSAFTDLNIHQRIKFAAHNQTFRCVAWQIVSSLPMTTLPTFL